MNFWTALGPYTRQRQPHFFAGRQRSPLTQTHLQRPHPRQVLFKKKRTCGTQDSLSPPLTAYSLITRVRAQKESSGEIKYLLHEETANTPKER